MRSKSRMCGRRAAAALSAAVLLGIGSTTARANTLTWDPDLATAGAQGGSGTWSNDPLNLNWYDGVANVPWVNAPTDAVFGGTAGTVTLDPSAAITAGSITFNVPGYTLESGTLVCSSITAASNASITSSFQGGTFNKWGAGTLRLAGSVSGFLTVNEGTLRLDRSQFYSSPVNVASGAGLILNAPLTLGASSTFS